MPSRVMRFLGGAKLAAVLLAIVAIVLIGATVTESKSDAETARRYFYGATWFVILLVLVGVNVLAAAVNRFPWRWRHAGFVVTHLAVLVTLAGAIVTRWLGIEGQLQLAEGQSTAFLVQTEPVVEIEAAGRPRRVVSVDLLTGPLGELGRTLRLRQYLANSAEIELAEPSSHEGDGPAISLVTEDSAAEDAIWLVANDPNHRMVAFGSRTIRFVAAESAEALQRLLHPPTTQPTARPHELVLDLGERGTFRVPVAGERNRAVPLGETGLVVRILEVYTHAIVGSDGLVNKSPELVNPAVVFELDGPQGTETHTVFARFPQFASLHGKTSGAWSGVKARYLISGLDENDEDAGVIVCGPGDQLHYRFRAAGDVSGSIGVGRWFHTPWSPTQLKVARLIPSATLTTQIVSRPASPDLTGNVPAMHLAAGDRASSPGIWLRWGQERTFPLVGGECRVYFGRQREPLHCTVTLKDFRRRTHPGTNRPASFESDVVFQTEELTLGGTIRMNHPMTFGGFTFYQSSYQQMGDVEVSILSVSYDPGTPIAYVGFVVLIVGVLITTIQQRLRERHAAATKRAAAERLAARGTESP